MKRIKELFQTPKKAAISIVGIAALLTALAVGTVLAAENVARSTSIGEDQAENYAFADAGVDPVSAKYVETEFDYEQGQFVYEVDFEADNTEYEYWIKASDGTVVKKKSELLTQPVQTVEETTVDSDDQNQAGKDENQEATVADDISEPTEEKSADNNSASETTSGGYIGVDKAKEIALKHAGVSADSVKFSKAKLENDDGVEEYDIEFYRGRMEYEYEIHAVSGKILEYDSEYDDD